MKIDIEQTKIEAKRKKKSRLNFIKSLKNKKEHEIDVLFQRADHDVFEEINCLSCANCCKTVGPLFTDKDIEKNNKDQIYHLLKSPLDLYNNITEKIKSAVIVQSG